MLFNFRALALALGLCVLPFVSPQAQVATNVTTCGTQTLGTGNQQFTMDSTGKLCVNAAVTASLSGFTAATTGTPISVTSSSSSGTLPAGAVVVATNVGATNGAYCALGASGTTASQYLSPGGGWFAFTVGAATQLSCITSTSTTTVNMTGGAGLPTGTGGGGSGGLPAGASTSANQASILAAINAAALTTPFGVYNQPSASATYGLSSATCAALCTSQIIKASAGNLYSFDVAADATLSPSPWWVMIFNLTSAPGSGSVTPLKCYALPAQATNASISFQTPIALSTGITIAVSTAGCFTYTPSTHAFISGDFM